MTATGSHIDFGFAARGTTLQGKPYATPVRRMELKRAGHAAAPTRNYELPTAPHPAALRPPSPRGRLFFSSPLGIQEVEDYTPLSQSFGLTAPPTRREPYSERASAYF